MRMRILNENLIQMRILKMIHLYTNIKSHANENIKNDSLVHYSYFNYVCSLDSWNQFMVLLVNYK